MTNESLLANLYKSLRAGQRGLGDWECGRMAVAAVPGAGKSHSLSVAATLAIARNQLNASKQILIVTYTRSAAANIKEKIKSHLQTLQLPANAFIVQTLHSLALQIASRHPNLSQLDLETATLIIPTPSHRLIRTCVEQWIALAPKRYQTLLTAGSFDGEEAEILRRHSALRTDILPQLAYTVIREAKSSGLTPQEIYDHSERTNDEYEILAIAGGLYQQYEQLMRAQNYIDYDDMITAALRVLEDSQIRQNWQRLIFGVFEDEAQDSSPLQGKLITRLAENADYPEAPPNLIRVGDPNQAINSTFTPADPLYFRLFCHQCELENRLSRMNQAGRSSKIIMRTANLMLQWVNQHWSTEEKPFEPQEIIPVPEDDSQPDANPEPVGQGVEIHYPDDIYQTVELIKQQVIRLLKTKPEHNAAILVRENSQGRFLKQRLANLSTEQGIEVLDASEGAQSSKIPGEMLKLLQFIDRPHSPENLKGALEILEEHNLIESQDLNALATYPEKFLYPSLLEHPQKPSVAKASRFCTNLLRAKIELPHYQLIAFLGMTLKYDAPELATAHKLGDRLNQEIAGRSSLKALIATLQELVGTENFYPVEEETESKYTRTGQLTIITMHKAKGLDWDYVFIPFLHEDILPGKSWTPPNTKFLGSFSIAEVARAQIRSIVHSQHQGVSPLIPTNIKAAQQAEKLKQAEEYRLLYVAMTRAKRLLWMSAEKLAPFRWGSFRDDGGRQLQTKRPTPVLGTLLGKS